jgi:predicted tellurium resistance membrane protein TerC
MEWLWTVDAWASLLTLTVLEVVLGIDNLVFIAVLANRLPVEQRALARRLGLAMALLTRLALLGSIAWIAGLTAPVFDLFGQMISWRDMILILGGGYLIYKGTVEIHNRIEGDEEEGADGAGAAAPVYPSFAGIVAQIMVIDIVFSLDSVITAVGMAQHIEIMMAAVIIAVIVMVAAANPIGDFIHRHPTVEMLAFAFILLVGAVLVADGFEVKVPKGYVYGAIAFSILVEALNIATRRKKRRKSS